MPMSTDDCKALLAADPELQAMGASDAKKWKRESKSGSGLVIRIFSHPAGPFAEVQESGGSIRIAAAAASLAGLADPKSRRAHGAEAEAEAPDSSSELPNALASRALRDEAAAAVKAYVDDWVKDGLRERCLDCDPVALANQYVFALSAPSDGGDYGDPDDLRVWIAPLVVWNARGRCDEQPAPIGHLMPGSDDSDNPGTWSVPGFGGGAELASHLLSLGFAWDRAFQRFVDECEGHDGMAGMEPLFEAQELAASTPLASRSAPAPRV